MILRHIKEPTIGTYTEDEIVKVFAERGRYRAALERISNLIPDTNTLGEAVEIADSALA